MKKFLLFCFVCLPLLSNAQNWSIINTTDKFNYRLDGDPVITATIWADSVFQNGNDSIFYLNRFLCDSCIFIPHSFSTCDSCFGYKNAPGFLQRSILLSNNIYNLRDTDNVYLDPYAQLNDTWIFDSIENVTAQIVSTTVDSVFITTDSIKIILLSTGDSISISKNFGLLKYPNGYNTNQYYRLAGIEGRNLGEQVPKFFEFFNFDIGDMFEFHTNLYIGGGCGSWRIEQYTINSKVQLGDTLRYSFSGVYEEKEQPNGWQCSGSYWFGHFSGTKEFIDSVNHFTNKYNRQPVKLAYQLQNSLPCANNDSAFDAVRMSMYVNNLQSKSFGFPGGFGSAFYSEINIGSDTLDPNSPGPYAASYVEGLGCTGYAITPCFEGGEFSQLTAFKKGNFIFGNFSDSTAILLGLANPVLTPNIIFPNPAIDFVYIRNSDRKNLKLELINILGQSVLCKDIFSDNPSIQIDNVPNGIYLVKIFSKDETIINKLVISH